MTVTISIGSGKGGTGKSMVIANLAVLLAKTGQKVCLVDLDLGGSDVHILFGLFEPKRTLTDFLTRQVESITDVIHTLYSYNGLQVIPGTGDTLQTSNMSYQEKQRLFRGLESIEADILLIDIGAGTSYHALDFFMQSDVQVCVTLPDPTAIMDLYTFLQLATIRKVLSGFLSQSDVATALKNHNFRSLQEVFELAEKTREGARNKGQLELKYFHPLLVINRDSENNSINKRKLRQMVTRYLGIDIPELGEIPEDSKVNEALKAFMPISELHPSSPASEALAGIAEKITRIVELFNHHNHRK
ncbi:MAG: P-loop NTPase [Desulforhopalus sp.]